MKFKRSVLFGIPLLALGLVVFISQNDKRGDVIMPSKTISLIVPPASEDDFEQAIRDYAAARNMVVSMGDAPEDKPGFLTVALQGNKSHINISRLNPDDKRTTKVYFFAPKPFLGMGQSRAEHDSAQFIDLVTKTPGVTVAP